MIPIPAIDILDGSAVRLRKGDYGEVTRYGDDPLDTARTWLSQGADLLHVVDLDGARRGAAVNGDVIAKIAGASEVPVQVGGGIRTVEDVDRLLDAGVDRVVIGTAAVTDPDLVDAVIDSHGADALVIALDARAGEVALDGWVSGSGVSATSLASTFGGVGVVRFLVTSIEVDGTMDGPDLRLLEDVAGASTARVIASGGVGSVADLELLARRMPELEGVIIGRALYEGAFTLTEARKALEQR